MFALLWDLIASTGRGLSVAGITMVMLLLCISAVLFTLVVGAPMHRLKIRTRGRPSLTRANLLRR